MSIPGADGPDGALPYAVARDSRLPDFNAQLSLDCTPDVLVPVNLASAAGMDDRPWQSALFGNLDRVQLFWRDC
jgi:hypothetical protein